VPGPSGPVRDRCLSPWGDTDGALHTDRATRRGADGRALSPDERLLPGAQDDGGPAQGPPSTHPDGGFATISGIRRRRGNAAVVAVSGRTLRRLPSVRTALSSRR
jgi:hypothetical protein